MKITKRQLRRIIKEAGDNLVSSGKNRDENVYNAAYDVIMDLITEEMYAGPQDRGDPAPEIYNAWLDALRDVADELELEMKEAEAL